MSNKQLDDLKQFIDSRLSQSEARFDAKLDKMNNRLNKKMDNGFAGIVDAVDQIYVYIENRG